MRRLRPAVVIRSAAALAALALALAATPLPGRAASPLPSPPPREESPPPGVSFDGVVNVIVREAAGPGRIAGRPIAGATVVLHVSLRGDPANALQSMTDTTAADGIATFAGVAGPEPGGPRVELDVTAHAETVDVLAGCPVSRSWDGVTHDTASGGTDELVVEVTPSSSIACPKPVLTGRVRTLAGRPVPVGRATASLAVGGGAPTTLRLRVAKDGQFAIELPARGTKRMPATLTVSVVGAVTRTEQQRGGCIRTIGEQGVATRQVALADNPTLAHLDVTVHEFVVAERCPTIRPRPAPGSHGPSPKPRGSGGPTPLPPTDTIATAARAGFRHSPGAADVVVVTGFGALGAVAAGYRRRRRGC